MERLLKTEMKVLENIMSIYHKSTVEEQKQLTAFIEGMVFQRAIAEAADKDHKTA